MALENALVYAQTGIVNRDYEGEIKKAGDSVKISSIGDIDVNDYVKDTNIGDPQTLTDAEQTLIITESKYYNFAVDSISKAQQSVNTMDTAMKRAAFKLADVADRFVAASYVNVPSGNLIGSDGSAIVPSKTTAYEYLVDMGVLMTEKSIPTQGRFVIVPPWFYGLIQKDDRFVKSGTPTGDLVLRNGEVGEAAGFRVLQSNNVPNTGGALYKIISGTDIAYSYAEQIVETQSYKPEKRFGDAVKGLHVYGGKLVRPDSWVVMTASKT